MRILLDECIPHLLSGFLIPCEVHTAQQMGWGGITNGILIRKAEEHFDLFLTADKNLQYQQTLTGRKISILVLATNHWPTLKTHGSKIASAVMGMRPGEFKELEFD